MSTRTTPPSAPIRSSTSLAQASAYHLSLNLEVLRGCQFSCKGCHVQKHAAERLSEESARRLARWVDSAVSDASYVPTMVFVSPTDVLACDNAFEVFDDPRLIGVIRQFRRLSIQTTALSLTQAPALAALLRKHFSHMELEVNILLEPEHVRTPKYLALIRANRDALWQLLDWPTPLHSFCILNVYEYSLAKNQDTAAFLADYEALHQQVVQTFGTTLDFNLSMGRKANPAPGEVGVAIHRVKTLFNEGVKATNTRDIRFSFGKLTDSLVEHHYNFLNGEFYVSPMLYDRYAAFLPQLRVPFVDYTAAESQAFEEKLELAQYLGAPAKAECGGCEYLTMCVSRNLLTTMDAYDIRTCIVAKDAVNAINRPLGPSS